MATVALSPVGAGQTVPVDWSPLTTNRLAMTAFRLQRRVASWLSLEPRTDAWASYAALGVAGVATVAILALGHF